MAANSFAVPISAVFASPRAAFDALKTFPGTRRPLLLTLAALPLLPLLLSVEFHAGLQRSFRESFLAETNTATAEITITGITGLLFLFTQAGLLLAHYLMFALWTRIFGLGGSTAAKAVWWYALTPLMFRQIFYSLLITLTATPKLEGISWAGYADPFIAWSGALIYLGCRHTLGGDRKTSLAVAVLSCSIAFLLPMTQLISLV